MLFMSMNVSLHIYFIKVLMVPEARLENLAYQDYRVEKVLVETKGLEDQKEKKEV